MEYNDPYKTLIEIKLKIGIQIWDENSQSPIYPINKLNKYVDRNIFNIINKSINTKGRKIIKDIGLFDIKKFNYDQISGIVSMIVKPIPTQKNKGNVFSYIWGPLITNMIDIFGEGAADTWLEGDANVYQENDTLYELHLDLVGINIQVPSRFDKIK